MNPYGNRDFFDYNEECEKHERYHCPTCKSHAENAQIRDGEIVEVVSSQAISVYEPKVQDGMKDYKRQLSFIQKVKKWSDKKMASIKITELKDLLLECQKECTVGDFNEYIEEEESNTGFWSTLFGKNGNKRVKSA